MLFRLIVKHDVTFICLPNTVLLNNVLLTRYHLTYSIPSYLLNTILLTQYHLTYPIPSYLLNTVFCGLFVTHIHSNITVSWHCAGLLATSRRGFRLQPVNRQRSTWHLVIRETELDWFNSVTELDCFSYWIDYFSYWIRLFQLLNWLFQLLN